MNRSSVHDRSLIFFFLIFSGQGNGLVNGFTDVGAYVDGFLERPDFLAAVAEFEERDECERHLKRQHHLPRNFVPASIMHYCSDFQ